MVKLHDFIKGNRENLSEFIARSYFASEKCFVYGNGNDKANPAVKGEVWTREKAQMYMRQLECEPLTPVVQCTFQQEVCAHRGVQPVKLTEEAIGEDVDKTVYLCPVCGADLFPKED